MSFEEIRGQFETNFFGVVRTCKAVIPTMRKQGSGTIIIIGSLGGRVGLLPFLTQYHASKFALEGFTESLRQELAEFGINVVLIEPGTIRTNFENNTKTAKNYKRVHHMQAPSRNYLKVFNQSRQIHLTQEM